MASVETTITNADINNILGRFSGRLLTLEQPLRDFAEYKLLKIREGFDREQGPDGRRWKDISPAWRAQKKKEGRPTQIGVYTRQLRDTITYFADGRSLVIGSPAPHAGYFQEDREFLGLTREDRRELLDTLGEYIIPT